MTFTVNIKEMLNFAQFSGIFGIWRYQAPMIRSVELDLTNIIIANWTWKHSMITGLYNTQNRSGEKKQITHAKEKDQFFWLWLLRARIAWFESDSIIWGKVHHLLPMSEWRKPTERSKQTKTPPSNHIIQDIEWKIRGKNFKLTHTRNVSERASNFWTGTWTGGQNGTEKKCQQKAHHQLPTETLNSGFNQNQRSDYSWSSS